MSLALLALLACSHPQILHKGQWIMGTVVEITWVGSPDAEGTIESAFDMVKSVDAAMNPDKPGSELYRVNAHAGKGGIPVSPMSCRVIQEGLRIGHETGGAFDIAMGPLIRLWGWDTKTPRLPSREAITRALAKTGLDKVTCDPTNHRITLKESGMSLDLGGIAKGFAVDLATKRLRKGGIANFIINAGGDLYVSGNPPGRPWRIGIQDPDNPRAIIASLPLKNRAIATSGDYENYFMKDNVRYHHLLDPTTGFPARGLRSVSVLAKTTMDADALATALFVMGKKRAIRWLQAHPDTEGILVDSRLHVDASSSLKGLIKWKKRFKKRVSYF